MIKQGVKAITVLPPSPHIVGQENSGIKVHVDRMAMPQEVSEMERTAGEGPYWIVTALDRPFTQFVMLHSPDNRYMIVKPSGTASSAIFPTKFLRRIQDDDTDQSVTTTRELELQ